MTHIQLLISNMDFLTYLFFIFALFYRQTHFAHSTEITSLRLDRRALDKLICPSVTKILQSQLLGTFTWASLGTWNSTKSRIVIGIPLMQNACQYELMSSPDALRLFMNWHWPTNTPQDIKIETTVDLKWSYSVISATCVAKVRIDFSDHADHRIDEEDLKQKTCDQLITYFTETPTVLVAPVLADLNLIYALKSVYIHNGSAVTLNFLTSVDELTNMEDQFSLETYIEGDGTVLSYTGDLNVINELIDKVYRRNSDNASYVIGANDSRLRADCGRETPVCLGSLMQILEPARLYSPYQCVVKIDSKPDMQINKINEAVLRASGMVNMKTAAGEKTILKAEFRIVARLNAKVDSEHRLTAWTSIQDVALMMSEFVFNRTDNSSTVEIIDFTDNVVKKLNPIFVDLINAQLAVGVPLPLPRKSRLMATEFIHSPSRWFKMNSNIDVV